MILTICLYRCGDLGISGSTAKKYSNLVQGGGGGGSVMDEIGDTNFLGRMKICEYSEPPSPRTFTPSQTPKRRKILVHTVVKL